jgi:predicted nucleic acid-binding Zn ribbon protein
VRDEQPQLPVTQDTHFVHRSGDNSVDSVDNTVSELSPGVTKRPNEGVRSTPPGVSDSDRAQSPTDGDSATGPNGTRSDETQPQGRDLARAALEAVREKARTRGSEPGVRKQGRGGGGSGGQHPRRRRWSGAGADARDPQPLGRVVSRLAVDRGWNAQLANGLVFGHWTRLVGEEVAEHAQPVALREGELTVRASSTAWATQLRLLQGQLLKKIAAGVGHGVVKRMRIQGPTAPSWRKGPRHVSGRGPRDTYG